MDIKKELHKLHDHMMKHDLDYGEVKDPLEIADEIARLRKLTEWQPIETAPKDGTTDVVLYWGYPCPHSGEKTEGFEVGYWDSDWKMWNTISGDTPDAIITHWMPLPAPPVEP